MVDKIAEIRRELPFTKKFALRVAEFAITPIAAGSAILSGCAPSPSASELSSRQLAAATSTDSAKAETYKYKILIETNVDAASGGWSGGWVQGRFLIMYTNDDSYILDGDGGQNHLLANNVFCPTSQTLERRAFQDFGCNGSMDFYEIRTPQKLIVVPQSLK